MIFIHILPFSSGLWGPGASQTHGIKKPVAVTLLQITLAEPVSVMTHDMLASPANAAAAVQELWCGVKRMDGTFLHSPLLEELKSLEVRLVRQAYRLRKGKGSADGSTDSSRKAAAGALQSVHSVSVDLPVQVSNPWLRMSHKMQLGPDLKLYTRAPVSPADSAHHI